MDKVTLGQYGWIIVVALALTTLFMLATPLGTSFADSIITLIRGTSIFSNEAYSDESIKEQTDYMNDLFDYSDSLQPGLYMHNDPATQVFTWKEYVENSYISINAKGETVAKSKTSKTNGDLIMGDDVIAIGGSTFSNSPSLYLVRLGVATKVVKYSAFSDCVNLRTFRSNKHLTTIEANVFKNNYNLQNVFLKDELVSIGHDAFSGCYKLKQINYSGTDRTCKTREGRRCCRRFSGAR